MNNLINLKNKSLFLFIFLFIYYFISPYIFLFDNFISRANIFIGEVDYINNSNKLIFFIYNTLSIIFLFFIFIKLRKILLKENLKKKNEFKIVFFIIILVCLFFLIIDIINIVNYRLVNQPVNRTLMYEAVLNKRNTHINILIIIATASFYENKKLSIFSYLTLIIYSFLSYSRIELILLLSIIFCTMNFNKKFNLSIYFSFFLFGIITIFYRFYLSDQNFLYVFMDPLHLNINTFNLIDNYNIKELIFLFTENLKFILNDFFYIKQNLHNFFQNNSLPTYSKKGIDTVFLYIIPFIFYFYILVFLRKYFFVTQFFLSSIFVFLIISLFRGNFVHNIGFIIKLYIMILISEWIVRKIKLWLSREA